MESDNVVVLLHKEAVSQKTKTITGTIVDSSGESVIGASIVVKRNHQRHYHRCRRKLLIVKRPGELYRQHLLYRLSTVELSGIQQGTFQSNIKEDAEMLDEVIVVGYGTTKRQISQVP